ncbi:hypothetical protein RND71_019160 [Anisodus tanguticus]|uniref:LysM domain-containing protein n=1 Tax=Anisodus tanguticus TaxID=243964 RepID=A0AAE1RYH4_9SOLA|nr:hypothetical protein RND71_019160 [Anisodus tanguticus]
MDWERRVNGGVDYNMTSSYIQHPVSKFDTLAGVAIRYGVEVADIKRINGLVSDLQMFALKTLHIPLPGRHPPSPVLSNGQDTRSGWFSAVTGKGLALRPKSANRTLSGADAEASSASPIPIGLGDSLLNDSASVVRKSSSTSNLQDSDSSTLSSLWNLKPDFQAISTSAIPKPITGRRNKAALD